MGRISQEIISEEVDRLKEMVQTGEILRYSERDLEKQFKLTRKTLKKHLNEIKAEIGTRDIKVITIRLINILDEIMNDIEKLWRQAKEEGNEQKIVYYTKQMFMAMEKFTDFLERFGIKQKIADKHEFTGVIVNANVDVKQVSSEILSEIRTLK